MEQVRLIFLFLVLVCACASAGYSYKFYGLEQVNYSEGKLVGPEPKDDLPFSRCAPDESSQHKCVVMFADEFYRAKLDFEATQQKLKECEKK